MLPPLVFRPIFKERIWGGRDLAGRYGKPLPPGKRIGESWEISDRPSDETVVAGGPFEGRSLRWLLSHHGAELLGPDHPLPPRFPLLIKIIDAREVLSLQVHPPTSMAASLGGEPKTEMWYVAQAEPKAELFVGLKKGVTRGEFERRLADQTVAECFHRIAVKEGDAMFLPSGRVHALGGGIVIFEIQQNSDTTYRVFDWNRLDDQGKPRQLHIEQSLASIDFTDMEPGLLPRTTHPAKPGTLRPLVSNELFEVNLRQLPSGESLQMTNGRMEIIGVTEGFLRVGWSGESVELGAGHFCLVPAQSPPVSVWGANAVTFLEIYGGRAGN